MTDQKEAPRFYGEPQMGQGQTVPHAAGIEARLAAAGVGPAKTLEQFQREKAEKADMAAEHTIMGIPAKMEPTTEKTVSGHSPEKKAAMKMMESEKITLSEALERVKSDAQASKKKATRKTGKGE